MCVNAKLLYVALVAIVIFGLDHYTKWLIVENLSFDSQIPIIDGIFEIVHTRNQGAAFGLLHAWNSPYRNLFFYTIGLCAFWFLYLYVKSTPDYDKLSLTALAGITGGAAGNLTDRFYRGSVVDFVHLHYHNKYASFTLLNQNFGFPLSWPAFNVADSAITIGVVFLLCRIFFPAKNPL